MRDLKEIPSRPWKRAEDAPLNIDAIHRASPKDRWFLQPIYRDCGSYSPPGHWDQPRIIHKLELMPADVIFDFYFGLVSFACLCANRPVPKIIGVEINLALAAQCERDVNTLRARTCKVEIRVEDAAIADGSGVTVLCLFHPFGEATLRCSPHQIGRAVCCRPAKLPPVCSPEPQRGAEEFTAKKTRFASSMTFPNRASCRRPDR
jgi:hypothetical protein